MHLEETELSLFAYDMITHIRGGQPFSVKGQGVSILGFAGHRISVPSIQLCHSFMKAATDNT